MCFGAHAMMENRNGLLAAIDVHNPVGRQEPEVALAQIRRLRGSGQASPATVAGIAATRPRAVRLLRIFFVEWLMSLQKLIVESIT